MSAHNFIDLTGRAFGRLTVAGAAGKTSRGQIVWLCNCDCGGEAKTTSTKLKTGHTSSCGCYKADVFKATSAKGVAANIANGYRPEDGARFGRLVVLGPAENIGRQWASLCRCDCGTEKRFENRSLKHGISTSCGCRRAEEFVQRNTIHGLSRVMRVLYRAWNSMIYRCYDENCASFKDYGSRGITVCDRWRFGADGLTGFECFAADMGERPSPSHSLDREDNDGPYEPDNCRWATAKEQANNRRPPSPRRPRQIMEVRQ